MEIRPLIVDDHPMVRGALRHVFESAGITNVEEAATCDDALRRVRREQGEPPLDVVLLDIVMPDGSGMDLLGEFKAQDSNLPVLMHTCQDNPRYLELSFQAGASGYLVKGGDTRLILAAVRQVHLGGNAWTEEQMSQIREFHGTTTRATPRPSSGKTIALC
jgi:DNA-binding NarL/FixJ family response regulator